MIVELDRDQESFAAHAGDERFVSRDRSANAGEQMLAQPRRALGQLLFDQDVDGGQCCRAG